ncbi:MAG: hypothetical protein PHZ00_07780 [Candidatus Peribacteraceae bacterium]|nr:hypothetical protein [Candidatus Peribacteraceae bacterium]
MEATLITIGIILVVGIGVLIALQMKRPQSPMQDLSKDFARLEKDLENERAEKNRLSGANRQQFAELERLKAEHASTIKERDALRTTVTKSEAKKEQQEKEHRQMSDKLQAAEQAFKEERQRIIREEEESRHRMEEERDRIWAEHENAVVAQLLDLCKHPQLQFPSFTNKNLPEEFDGSLKPDFLIEFLGQYVIFDAKASKAQSLQTYIDDAVKKTAEKVRKNSKIIYPHVFLVVPTEAIPELRRVIYPKDELTFYVISREALAPILASLKRIAMYELAEQLDPQKRENIINMLSELDYHINLRNGMDLILSKMGADILEKTQRIDPELSAEVQQKKSEKRIPQFSTSELKKVVGSLTEQHLIREQLVSPEARIKKPAIKAAAEIITQKLL